MSSPAPSKLFFATLDAIRGVAAILVMMRHVPYFGALTFQESYLAVDVFFLLSGVVIANAYEQRLQQGLSLGRFAWMRVLRIYPLYLLGCTLMLLALWHSGQLPERGALLSMLVLGGLLLPNLAGNPPFPLNHPAWSLFFELLANLFYARLVRRLDGRRLALLVALAALGLVWLLGVAGQPSLDLGWSCATLPYGALRVAYSFFAGVGLSRLYSAQGARLTRIVAQYRVSRHGLPWLLLAAVAALLMASPAAAWQAGFDLLTVTLLFPGLIYLALCAPPAGATTGLARWLGVVSYPVYALHVPLSQWFGPLLATAFAPGSARVGYVFMAGLLPLCWLLSVAFDTPLRRCLAEGAEAGYRHYQRWRRPAGAAPR